MHIGYTQYCFVLYSGLEHLQSLVSGPISLCWLCVKQIVVALFLKNRFRWIQKGRTARGWCSVQRRDDGRSGSHEEMGWLGEIGEKQISVWWSNILTVLLSWSVVIKHINYFVQCCDSYLTLRKEGLFCLIIWGGSVHCDAGRHGRNQRQLLILHLQSGSR